MNVGAITAPGGPELIVILVIVVLLFGAKKLPELGSSVGKSIKNFKKGIGDASSDTPETPADERSKTASTTTGSTTTGSTGTGSTATGSTAARDE